LLKIFDGAKKIVVKRLFSDQDLSVQYFDVFVRRRFQVETVETTFDLVVEESAVIASKILDALRTV
jgi:hypothetical protein